MSVVVGGILVSDRRGPYTAQLIQSPLSGSDGNSALVVSQIPIPIDGDPASTVQDAEPFHGYIVVLPDPPVLGVTAVHDALERVRVLRSGGIPNAGTRAAADLNDASDRAQQSVRSAKNTIQQQQRTVRDALTRMAGTASRGAAALDAPEFGSSFSLSLNGFVVHNTLDPAVIAGVERSLGVTFYPNHEVHTTLDQSVPMIGANQVWTKDPNGQPCDPSGGNCVTGRGVRIGIIDTGIDYAHPDLGGCLGPSCKVAGGYDFINNDSDPRDDQGHGTHVAAIAAGKGVLKGVAPDAILYGFKVLSAQGSGTEAQVLAGIERSLDPNQDGNLGDRMHVVNLSLSCAACLQEDSPMSQAVDAIVKAGVVAVVAAGNAGPREGTIGSPSNAHRAITVAAVNTANADVAPFSSRGPVNVGALKPDIAAPGVTICAAKAPAAPWTAVCIDSAHVKLSGTSMATPHVAGVAALMIQAHPAWQPDEIKRTLQSTARYGASFDARNIPAQGYGIVDAYKAVTASIPPPALSLHTSGPLLGMIDIRGSIGPGAVGGYDLLLQANDSATPSLLVHGTTVPANGVLLRNFNSDTLLPGMRYYLILVVTDSGGKSHRIATIVTSGQRIELTSPLTNDVAKPGQPIRGYLQGTVQSYVLEYGIGHAPTTWSTAGIRLTGTPGRQGEQVLAEWDAATIPDGSFLTLRMRARRTDGNEVVFLSTMISFDADLRQGWPLRIESMTDRVTDVAVADLDGDGKKEVTILQLGDCTGNGETPHRIISYEPDGKQRWSVNLPSGYCASNELAIGDLEGDGKQEVFYAANVSDYVNSTFVEKTKIYALRENGTVAEGWPVDLNGTTLRLIAHDLDGDGRSELVEQESDMLRVLGERGIVRSSAVVPNFNSSPGISPCFNPIAAPALGNFDDDADLEIVVQINCRFVAVLNADGFMIRQSQALPGTPLALGTGDIDGDGKHDIVVSFAEHPAYVSQSGIGVLGRDARWLTGWPLISPILGTMSFAVAIGDVNRDGKNEIGYVPIGDTYIHVLGGNGQELPGWPQPQKPFQMSTRGLIFADIDGDSSPEVVLAGGGIQPRAVGTGDLQSSGGVQAWRADGTSVDLNGAAPFLPLFTELLFQSDPVVTDLEGNGRLDILVSSFANRTEILPYPPKKRGSVFAWELAAPFREASSPWSMARHDAGRTGCQGCSVPTPPQGVDLVLEQVTAMGTTPGQPTTYTTVVKNTGTAPATSLRFVQSFIAKPSEITFVQAASSPGCFWEFGAAKCPLSTLQPGQSHRFTVVVTATSCTFGDKGNTLVSWPSIVAAEPDPTVANNSREHQQLFTCGREVVPQALRQASSADGNGQTATLSPDGSSLPVDFIDPQPGKDVYTCVVGSQGGQGVQGGSGNQCVQRTWAEFHDLARRTHTGISTVAGPITPGQCDALCPQSAPDLDTVRARDHILVQFKTEARSRLSQKFASRAFSGWRRQSEIPVIAADVIGIPPSMTPEDAIAQLRNDPDVKTAEVDRIVPLASHEDLLAPNDPRFPEQWALGVAGAEKAWHSAQGQGVIAAVADTGVDPIHPDLAAAIVPGWDFLTNTPFGIEKQDRGAHGTAVASVIAGIAQNARQIVGIAPKTSIMPLMITFPCGGTHCSNASTIASAIVYAADHGAKVINISFSPIPLASSPVLASAVAHAHAKHMAVVWAAGNDGIAPAGMVADPSVIYVSATTEGDERASFSNFGPYVDVAAPGVNILSLLPSQIGEGSERYVHGTSFSAPHVTGSLALIFSANHCLNEGEAEAVLLQSLEDLGAAGYDPFFGFGRVNVAKAVEAAAALPCDQAPSQPPGQPGPGRQAAFGGDVPVLPADGGEGKVYFTQYGYGLNDPAFISEMQISDGAITRQFQISSRNSQLTINPGNDGTFWFVGGAGQAQNSYVGMLDPKTGSIKIFPVPGTLSVVDILQAPSGDVFFTVSGSIQAEPSWIGRIKKAEIGKDNPSIERFSINLPFAYSMTMTPDGMLWVGGYPGKLAVLNPADLKEGGFPMKVFTIGEARFLDITHDGDGNVWMAQNRSTADRQEYGVILQTNLQWLESVDPQDDVKTFKLALKTVANGIAVHPNGSVWYTVESQAGDGDGVGSIDPGSGTQRFFATEREARPREITVGPDGNLWFTQYRRNSIGRVTPAGVLTSFPGAGWAQGIAATAQ